MTYEPLAWPSLPKGGEGVPREDDSVVGLLAEILYELRMLREQQSMIASIYQSGGDIGSGKTHPGQ